MGRGRHWSCRRSDQYYRRTPLSHPSGPFVEWWHDCYLGRYIASARKYTVPPAPAKLIVNSSPLDFGKLQQGNKVILSAVVKNSGGAPLSWTADTGDATWLMLQSSTGTIQPGEQQLIDVTADTSHL